MCQVASVDKVSCSEDVIGHVVKCSHVRITTGTTVTHRNIIAANLDTRENHI